MSTLNVALHVEDEEEFKLKELYPEQPGHCIALKLEKLTIFISKNGLNSLGHQIVEWCGKYSFEELPE